MSDSRPDPLLLGQRVVAILETGLRTATYKLATLMALVDYCIEHVPEDPNASVAVPIPDLAHRVLELYWHQVRPFEGKELRQSTQSPSADSPRRAAPAFRCGGRRCAHVAGSRCHSGANRIPGCRRSDHALLGAAASVPAPAATRRLV